MMRVVKSHQQTAEMRRSSEHDQHMEDLMRAAKQIKSSRVPPLRYSRLPCCQ
jgi:hypothetical protein